MRKFHGSEHTMGGNSLVIQECKSGDNCHGKYHFVQFNNQELKWLEKAIQSQKRTWVINEERYFGEPNQPIAVENPEIVISITHDKSELVNHAMRYIVSKSDRNYVSVACICGWDDGSVWSGDPGEGPLKNQSFIDHLDFVNKKFNADSTKNSTSYS